MLPSRCLLLNLTLNSFTPVSALNYLPWNHTIITIIIATFDRVQHSGGILQFVICENLFLLTTHRAGLL
jgi:hypothetical protein